MPKRLSVAVLLPASSAASAADSINVYEALKRRASIHLEGYSWTSTTNSLLSYYYPSHGRIREKKIATRPCSSSYSFVKLFWKHLCRFVKPLPGIIIVLFIRSKIAIFSFKFVHNYGISIVSFDAV